MRLVQVAKILGMTGQQLRHELSQVNFGIKPTDREIPDSVAKGVVRFLANKHGLKVNIDDLGAMVDEEEEKPATEEEAPQAQEEEASEPAATAAPAPVPAASVRNYNIPVVPTMSQAAAQRKASAELSVLRKLSLEGVSKEAIKRHQQTERRPSKAERDARLTEQKTQERLKAKTNATVKQQQIKKKEGIVMLPELITVKELAEKTGIQVPQLIGALMKSGVMVTINQGIDYDTAAIVATELGVQVAREQRAASAEHLISRNLQELLKDEPENLVARAPIVVIMGHVDHGKTSLLDAIRKTDVAGGEAGGITQHIGAYQVEHAMSGSSSDHRKITFLDTPGHEAFASMRARGAQVTDIVILVVAADEGVQPTTVEAINHIKEANVPLIVAITKMDREGADPDRVKGELAQHGIQPEEWGGTVPFVLCSAVTKLGISDLLDHILILAETKGVKANPKRNAIATVIESHLDTAHGPLASVIVNTGTLRVGDTFVCGTIIGRVKALMDAGGRRLNEVGPSGAARVAGLSEVPGVGDIIQVMDSEKEARALVEAVQEQAGGEKKRQLSDLVSRLSEGKLKQLKVILKADAQGSLEAIAQALAQLTGPTSDVTVKIIHRAIGPVTETDVMMASASEAIILAFNVAADVPSAERQGVQVREYQILYKILDDVTALLQGLVEPEEAETILGHLEVKGVFFRKKNEQVVGGKVTDGVIKRLPFRVMRDGAQIGTGRITSLKHVDKDIKEAKEGTECGMRIESAVEFQEGDVIEAYLKEWKKKEA